MVARTKEKALSGGWATTAPDLVSSGGSGSGEKNYITNPSAVDNVDGWVAVGDLVVARTELASELPRENTTGSGIKITANSGTQSTADYAYYDFDLDDVDLNKKLKIKLDQAALGTYSAGQFECFIAAQSDRTTAISGSTAADIVAATTEFYKTWDSASTAALSLVIRATEDMTEDDGIVISDCVVGPGKITKGPTITDWQSYTPSNTQGFGTITSVNLEYAQVGSSIYIRGYWNNGTISGDEIQLGLPPDMTVGGVGADTIQVGRFERDQSLAANIRFNALATPGDTYLNVGIASDASTVNPLSPVVGTGSFGAPDRVTLNAGPIPIAELAGRGTSNLMEVSRQSPLKAGLIMAWPDDTAPTGWLECDGSAVSRTTYSDLFAQIGEQYGNGDGSTTFELPDYRGYFLRGQDDGAGNDPDAASRTDRGDGTTGDNVGTKQSDAIKEHSVHTSGDEDELTIGTSNGGANAGRTSVVVTSVTSNTSASGGFVANAGDVNGNETRPKNVAVKWIIKAYNDSADVVGFGAATATEMGLVKKNTVETIKLAQDASGDVTDLSTSTGNSAFEFTGLTAGEWYELNMQANIIISGGSGTEEGFLQAVHDSTIICMAGLRNDRTTSDTTLAAVNGSRKFKATTTSVTFDFATTGSATIRGNDDFVETFAQLTHLRNYEDA